MPRLKRVSGIAGSSAGESQCLAWNLVLDNDDSDRSDTRQWRHRMEAGARNTIVQPWSHGLTDTHFNATILAAGDLTAANDCQDRIFLKRRPNGPLTTSDLQMVMQKLLRIDDQQSPEELNQKPTQQTYNRMDVLSISGRDRPAFADFRAPRRIHEYH